MSAEIDRRTLLRLSAALGIAVPALAASPGSAAGASVTRTTHSSAGPDRTPADVAADRIVASVRRPRFARRYFRVTDFGAVGDGTTMNTAAFAAAIATCGRSGGGHVIVPAGTFLTGAIHLRSRVNLHVTDAATILFSQD